MKNPSSLQRVLSGETLSPPPIWLMRQAGRYLPEYRAVRSAVGSFWTMCMTPELAIEVTLQPIRRFDLDAAILFSDILVIPYALGQTVRFEDGEGPVLDKFAGLESLICDPLQWEKKLSPIYEGMKGTRDKLSPDKALIGFAGAPWTLAAYMLEGKGSPDQRAAKLFAYREPKKFSALLSQLAECVAWHLSKQIDAGADAVQIFDSWAGGLPSNAYREWVLKPNKEAVDKLRKLKPDAKIIGFPRAVSQSAYTDYAAEVGVNAVGIDTATPIAWAAKTLSPKVAIQGNLDPIALIAGGQALDEEIARICNETRGVPFIFNLGHGVLPPTPPEHVARVVERVRSLA